LLNYLISLDCSKLLRIWCINSGLHTSRQAINTQLPRHPPFTTHQVNLSITSNVFTITPISLPFSSLSPSAGLVTFCPLQLIMAAVSAHPQHPIFPSHDSRISAPSTLQSRPVHEMQNQALEAVKDIVFGSTAGIVGKFIEYPFDTIKVRLQSQSTTHVSSSRLHGPLDAFAAAWRSSEGPLKSLYRGISAPLFGAAVETSSLFFSYRIAQDILVANLPSTRALETQSGSDAKAKLPFSALLVAGAASGAFTSFLLTPIELIKCKMQVPLSPSHLTSIHGYATSKPPGPLQLMRLVFRSQGLLGFWHGQLGTLIRETGGSASWFGSYEGVKILFEQYNTATSSSHHALPSIISEPSISSIPSSSSTSVPQQLLAGAIAGISYNFFFYPADTIKSRMQTEEAVLSGSRQTTFLKTGRELWNQQGLKGFYRGCGITVFRAAPSSAIIFGIYEKLRRVFG
jgi:mitochondrial ornithine carrier protein